VFQFIFMKSSFYRYLVCISLLIVGLFLNASFASAAAPTVDFTFNNGGSFEYPMNLTTDSSGNIYLADCGHTVSKFDSLGNFMSSIGDGTSGTDERQFVCPSGVVIDSGGNIYVLENGNHRIQKFSSSGIFINVWGSGVTDGMDEYQICTSSCRSGNISSIAGGFHSAQHIAIDSQNNLYISDYGNNRIQKFSSDGTFISAWGWGVTNGDPEYQICTSGCQAGISGSGDGQFVAPYAIGIDSSDTIYVGDNNKRISKLSPSGNFINTVGLGVSNGMNQYEICTSNCQVGIAGDGNVSFSYPESLTIDNTSSTLYVGDCSVGKIFRFNAGGTFIDSFGTLGSAPGKFSDCIEGIHISGSKMYISDADNFRVQVFTILPEVTSSHHHNSTVIGGSIYTLPVISIQASTPPSDCLLAYKFSPSTGVSCPMTATSLSANHTQLLKYKSKGPEVTILQDLLRSQHLFVPSSTGYFGLITKASLITFQKLHGLTPDGIVGPNTWKAITSLL
jgi:hypothetical protein